MNNQLSILSDILMRDEPTSNHRAHRKVESLINISNQILEILSSHREMVEDLSENTKEDDWIHLKNKSKTLWKAYQSYGTYGRKTFNAVTLILEDALSDGLDGVFSEAVGIFEIAERYELIKKLHLSGVAPELGGEFMELLERAHEALEDRRKEVRAREASYPPELRSRVAEATLELLGVNEINGDDDREAVAAVLKNVKRS